MHKPLSLEIRVVTWRFIHRIVPLIILLVLAEFSVVRGQNPTGTSAAKIDFARDIRPILANHCWTCHGPDEHQRQAGLRLDLGESARAALKNGHRAIVPGNLRESSLVARIDAEKESKRMPPADSKKPLSTQQKDLLRRWIEQGAVYSKHWAFTTPRRPELPAVKNKSWPRNPIDYFILQGLEQDGLEPAAQASRETLARRVALDLTGVPPSAEAALQFLGDNTPDAYEKFVDRLLASPRYGERMALYWLDLARYADTNGYNNDERRTMWPWRDWVINACNRNLPFDRFVLEQIAGDMLPGATLEQKIATGFNRNHVLTTEGGIFEDEYRTEYVADRVHTTATVFLGLSMQCARCHDHKYDPISQKEYYQFFAYFNNLPDGVVPYGKEPYASDPSVKFVLPKGQERIRELDQRKLQVLKQMAEREGDAVIGESASRWEKTLTADDLGWLVVEQGTDQAVKNLAVPLEKRTPEQLVSVTRLFLEAQDKNYQDKVNELSIIAKQRAEVEKSSTVACMVMADMPKVRDTFILKRGQYDQRGDTVAAGVPGALPPLPSGAPGNRLGLARWLIDPNNPLVARVAVNRYWALHFGSGLVETLEDFGLQGALPSHPELLDWLATEFIRTSWDVKALHRLIVTSATYRQSARTTPQGLQRDPKNRLLGRSPRYRLPAETVRDNALAISGLLHEEIGGPSVKPYQPAGLWEDVSVARRYTYVVDQGKDAHRRSMYTFWRRTIPPPAMTTFDAPDRETCVIRRARTNTPLQALILLNDPTYVEAARKLAEVMITAGPTPEDRLGAAFRRALIRLPRSEEQGIFLAQYRDALERFRQDPKAAEKLLSVGQSPRDTRLNVSELAAWTVVASTILNLDETMSRP